MRDCLRPLSNSLGNCQHPGLLFDRFFSSNNMQEDGREKTLHLQKVIASANQPEVQEFYKKAYSRWKNQLPDSPKKAGLLETSGRMVMGLGKASVLEVGIHLHHHLGFPFIPGSSLKGVCAHFCSKVWGLKDPAFQSVTRNDEKKSGDHHLFLFGDTTRAGAIRFEDAWWVPSPQNKSPFLMDIITPHHKDWQDDGEAPPSDFDSPTPVSFLSISGQFHFCITWQGDTPQNKDEESEMEQWLDLSWALLANALTQNGVGGKTSSGYGRFKQSPIVQEVVRKPFNGTVIFGTIGNKIERQKYHVVLNGFETTKVVLSGSLVPNTLAVGTKVSVRLENTASDPWVARWHEPQQGP